MSPNTRRALFGLEEHGAAYGFVPLDLMVDDARAEVDRCLRAVAGRLTAREYLVDRFSLAEIAIAPTLSAAPMLGIELARFPTIAEWMKRISSRPAWRKVQA